MLHVIKCLFDFTAFDIHAYIAVLGDSGKLYVAPECVPMYRSILPLATIITPNWFEVEFVSQLSFEIIKLTGDRGPLIKLTC